METKNKNSKASVDVQIKDLYCIIKSKEDGFYWVLNLDDHPNSFFWIVHIIILYHLNSKKITNQW